jgi:hypothetical protein
MAFAGIYDVWQKGDAPELSTAAIVTTSANELMSPVHDRMPVILPEGRIAEWLGSPGDSDGCSPSVAEGRFPSVAEGRDPNITLRRSKGEPYVPSISLSDRTASRNASLDSARESSSEATEDIRHPLSRIDVLTALLAPYPASEMEAFPVSRIVNSPRNDSEECVKPV